MIETKESLIGNINASQSLVGSLNKATEYITPLTQEKTATPSTNVQEITPDEEYTGLSKVTVEAVTNEIDENIQPSNIKLGVSILGIEGNLEPDKPDQTKEVTPTIETQIVTPDTGYELAQVQVNAVTSEIDENIVSENIKEGVSILGVEGSFVGGVDEELEASYRSLIDNTLGANVTKLPSGLTSIGDRAFFNRTSLALTSLPDEITSIGQYSFYGCDNLRLEKLPNNLTSIGNYAFSQSDNLALTELPESITSIGSNAFETCINLALKKLPSKLTRIENSVFAYCKNLEINEVPDGVTFLGTYSMRGCKKLISMRLPSVSTISAYSFYECDNLEEVIVGGNLGSMQGNVFTRCYKFSKLVLSGVTKVPTFTNTTAFTSTPIANGTGFIYVPDDLVDSFKSTTNWSNYADQIKGLSELV